MASAGALLYHEVQESKLCAVHCVNTVLQGPFFSEVDLATMAADLDSCEQRMMMESGIDSSEYLSFMAQGSSNVAIDGNFSIQVVQKALDVWDLRVIQLESPEATKAQTDPQLEEAFICHLQDHWFTIRKVGSEWYNFNSLYPAPEHLSPFYLSAYLSSLISSGWSIFVVRGSFPAECPMGNLDGGNNFGQWLTPEDAERITKATKTSGKEHDPMTGASVPTRTRTLPPGSTSTNQDLSALAVAMASSLANVKVPEYPGKPQNPPGPQ